MQLSSVVSIHVVADHLCEGGAGSCSHECAVVDGREQCFCPVGMELSPLNSTLCVGKCEILPINSLLFGPNKMNMLVVSFYFGWMRICCY